MPVVVLELSGANNRGSYTGTLRILQRYKVPKGMHLGFWKCEADN
jgi:hypothetical protein